MKPIRALVNADDVIRLLAEEGELSPAEIADRLDMPRPSVYRLLDGLSAIGLADPLSGSKTRLSLRWLHLADRAREAMVEWRGAKALLAELVERTGQTAYVSVLRGDEAVCLDWEQGRGIDLLVLRPGGILPLHAGAAGRVLLAFGVELESYLDRVECRRFTGRTLVAADELRADAALSRERGYALSDGDVTDGIAALGVPVYGADQRLAGALSLAGLRGDIVGGADEYVEALVEVADRIGRVASGE